MLDHLPFGLIDLIRRIFSAISRTTLWMLATKVLTGILSCTMYCATAIKELKNTMTCLKMTELAPLLLGKDSATTAITLKSCFIDLNLIAKFKSSNNK